MPFITIEGIKGKIYIPDAENPRSRKHFCKDCFYCQLCNDEKCSLCLKNKSPLNKEKDKSV